MARPLPLRPLVLAALAAVTLACPKDDEPEEVAPAAALEGEWRSNVLRAGAGVAAGTLPGWIRLRFEVAPEGTVTVHEVLDALGGTGLPTVLPEYACGADRAVTLVDGPLTEYLGQLDPEGGFWAATGSDAGSSQLRLAQRRPPGTSYGQADLEGGWHYHTFTVGATIRFEWGEAGVTADGTTTLTGRFSSSDGALEDLEVGRLLVDPEGLVTTEGGADPSWEGVLSAGKDLLVVSHTAPSSGPEYELILITRAATAAATAGVAGSWKVFTLEQDAGGGGWTRLTATITAGGTVTLSGYEDSWGGTLEAEPIEIAVAADGTITQVGNARWHGALSPGGDVWVATTDRDEGMSASLFVAIRR